MVPKETAWHKVGQLVETLLLVLVGFGGKIISEEKIAALMHNPEYSVGIGMITAGICKIALIAVRAKISPQIEIAETAPPEVKT